VTPEEAARATPATGTAYVPPPSTLRILPPPPAPEPARGDEQHTVVVRRDRHRPYRENTLDARVGPLTAGLRRPVLTLLPILVLLVPALALAVTRPATYGAESRLIVGRYDVDTTAVPGVVAATQNLAATYSRLASTDTIIDKVAAQLRVAPDAVRGHLSASPVPESTFIRVEATGSDPARALAVAQAGAQQLVAYAASVSSGTRDDPALLNQVRDAYLQLEKATSARDAAQAALTRARAAGTGVEDAQNALTSLQSAVDVAKLRVDTLSASYSESQRIGSGAGVASVVTPATATGSNRRQTLELAVALPVLGGGLLGLAMATLAENAGALRAARRRRVEGPGRR